MAVMTFDITGNSISCWAVCSDWYRKYLDYALLALCDMNPPITGGFPSQRTVMWKVFPCHDNTMQGSLCTPRHRTQQCYVFWIYSTYWWKFTFDRLLFLHEVLITHMPCLWGPAELCACAVDIAGYVWPDHFRAGVRFCGQQQNAIDDW